MIFSFNSCWETLSVSFLCMRDSRRVLHKDHFSLLFIQKWFGSPFQEGVWFVDLMTWSQRSRKFNVNSKKKLSFHENQSAFCGCSFCFCLLFSSALFKFSGVIVYRFWQWHHIESWCCYREAFAGQVNGDKRGRRD